MRGKLCHWSGLLVSGGLIPACAGKTCTSLQWAELPRAHPRVCGENFSASSRSMRAPGSSPRVRGKPLQSHAADRSRRLIPACAGKTAIRPRQFRQVTAHPRVCGENEAISRRSPCSEGSSPRVRGKPDVLGVSVAYLGLIPACAGKTQCRSSRGLRSRAHPRVCGENVKSRHFRGLRSGSSPRVRGKRVALNTDRAHVGLIPACAGKTYPRRNSYLR